MVNVDKLLIDAVVGTLDDTEPWSTIKLRSLKDEGLTFNKFIEGTAEEAKYYESNPRQDVAGMLATALDKLEKLDKEGTDKSGEISALAASLRTANQKLNNVRKDFDKYKQKGGNGGDKNKGGNGQKKEVDPQGASGKYWVKANADQKAALRTAREKHSCFACAFHTLKQVRHGKNEKCPNADK